MVDDPGDLIRVQARIDGVHHPARTADAKIHLHMTVAVPGQGGDTITRLKAHRIQRIGQPARPCCKVAVGVAVDVTFHPPGDNFGVAMVALSELQQRRNQKWLTLHQSQHVCSFISASNKNDIIVTGESLALDDDCQIHKPRAFAQTPAPGMRSGCQPALCTLHTVRICGPAAPWPRKRPEISGARQSPP